jgi:hypothetical protein
MEKIFHVDYLKTYFKDFARSNLYTVELTIPDTTISSEEKTKVEMSAKTVNLPPFEIGKQEIRRMDQRFFLPTSQNYGDIQMTLFCDSKYSQRHFIHNWLYNCVYNTDHNIFNKMQTILGSSMRIIQFNNKFEPIFTAEFRGIWPTSIGEISLSYDADSQIVEFPVSMSYTSYMWG